MRRPSCALALTLACAFLPGTSTFSHAAGAEQQPFVTARLAHGASVSIPKSWNILNERSPLALSTISAPSVDLSGFAFKMDGVETLLVAVYPDPVLYASISVTTAAAPSLSPSTPTRFTKAQIKTIEAGIRQTIEKKRSKVYRQILEWTPLEKVAIGRHLAMHTSYLRNSAHGPRKVHVYKHFGEGRLFDVVLSTYAKSNAVNGPILEKIARSFTFPLAAANAPRPDRPPASSGK